MIDYTLLKPEATSDDIIKLCREAAKHRFTAVCVNSSFVRLAARELEKSPVKVCTVVGFPLGASSIEAKVAEAKQAAIDGADEIDMVLNIGALKEGDSTYLMSEGDRVIEGARDERKDILFKFILEMPLLNQHEILLGCWVATGTGADFVKTSTGFATRAVTVEDVRFLRSTVGDNFGVKAAGGIKDLPTALSLIDAGAQRLGTSSALQILSQWPD
ncbi:MAG: deoxyribose-phosphate aldolase [Peptococcaceae bacterium]|nr:deoxyribose-phosphate aldolase [Peptococcaceae bacterium]